MKKLLVMSAILLAILLSSGAAVYADTKPTVDSLPGNVITNYSAQGSSGWTFYNYRTGRRGIFADPEYGNRGFDMTIPIDVYNYFLPSPAGSGTAYMTQTIDLTDPDIKSLVESEQLYFQSYFYFYGPHESGVDHGCGIVTCYASDGSEIKNWRKETEDWWNRTDHDNPDWIKYSFFDDYTLAGMWNRIPSNTAKIVVLLEAHDKHGDNMDAYFDDVIFNLSDKKPPELEDISVFDWDVNKRPDIDKYFPDRQFEYIGEKVAFPLRIQLDFDEPVTAAAGSRLKLNIVNSSGAPVYATPMNVSASKGLDFEYMPAKGDRLVGPGGEDNPAAPYDRIVVTGFEGKVIDANYCYNEWDKRLPQIGDTALYSGITKDGIRHKPFRLDTSLPDAEIEYAGDPGAYKDRHTGINLKHMDADSTGVIYKYQWEVYWKNSAGDSQYFWRQEDPVYTEGPITIDAGNDKNGRYKLKLWVYDMAWNEDYVEMTFNQEDWEAPKVTFDYNGTVMDQYKKSHILNAKAGDALSSLMNNEIYYKWSPESEAGKVALSDCSKAGVKGDDGYILTPGADGAKTGIPTPEGASGTYYLHIIAEDNRNNVTHSVSEGFLLDNEGPYIDVNSDKIVSRDLPIQVTAAAADTKIGKVDETSLYYQLVKSGENPDNYPEEWKPFKSGSTFEVSCNTEGIYELCFKAMDILGNSKDPALGRYTLSFDYSGPRLGSELNYFRWMYYGSDCDIQVNSICDNPTVSNGYNAGVDYSSWYYQWSSAGTPNDANWKPLAGEGAYRTAKADNGLEGEYILFMRISDNLGNTTVYTDNNSYKIDTRPPRISFSVNGSNGTSVKSVSTTVSYTDRMFSCSYKNYGWSQSKVIEPAVWSGLDGYSAAVTKSDFTEDGEWYLWVKAADPYKNTTTAVSNAFIIDCNPPGGSVEFTRSCTNTPDNELKLTVDDPEAQMQFSADGTNWTEWEGFKTYKEWALGSYDEGLYKAYARFRDKLGNTSGAYEAQITMDRTQPSGTITYSNTEMTAGDVTATLTPVDASKITVLNNDGSYDCVFVKNGEFEFLLKDEAGNLGRVTAAVSNIDKTPPKASLSYSHSLTEWTSESITCAAALDDSEAVFTNEGGSTHTFDENGEFIFEFQDDLGNKDTVTAAVYNIDKTPPVGEIFYSTKDASASPVTVYLQTNEPVTVTNNGGSIQKIFKENGSFTFDFTDRAGLMGTAAATVENIDPSAPSFDILYSVSDWTKENVTVTYSVYHDDDIQIIDPAAGKEYFQVFTENGVFPVTAVFSSTEEEGTVTGAVYNIDRTPPTAAYVNYSTKEWTEEPVTVTILPADDRSASVKILNNGGSPAITFSKNGEFTFELEDDAGNIGKVTVAVNNISGSIPVPLIGYSMTAPTDGPVTATLSFEYDYPVEIVNNNGINTYTFVINGEYTFNYRYGSGKMGTAIAKVENINSTVTESNITYYYAGSDVPLDEAAMSSITSKSIVARISFAAPGCKVLNNDGKTDYVFDRNGQFVFLYEDSSGLQGHKVASVSCIDRDAPTSDTRYNTTNPTKYGVQVDFVFNEPVEILEKNFTIFYADKNEEGLYEGVALYTGDNGTFTVKVRDKAGNISDLTAEVSNIDKTAPKCSISYIPEGLTNKDVVAVVSADEPITVLYNDEGNCSHTFTQNGSFDFHVEDLAGNSVIVTATVNNIDRAAPVLTVKYPDGYSAYLPINQNVEAVISANEEIRVLNNGGNISHTFTKNGFFTFEVEDLAGNTAAITVTVRNIDKEAPQLLLNGEEKVSLLLGEAYEEPGAVAVDNFTGDLTSKITIDGIVDSSKPGIYILTYSITDTAGNTAELERSVRVVSPEELSILVNGNMLEGDISSTAVSQIRLEYFGAEGSTSIKWAQGWQEEGYFKTEGTILQGGKLIEATRFGWYTVFFQDQERRTRLLHIYFTCGSK